MSYNSNRKDDNRPDVNNRLGPLNSTNGDGIARGFRIAGSHSGNSPTVSPDYIKFVQTESLTPTTTRFRPSSAQNNSEPYNQSTNSGTSGQPAASSQSSNSPTYNNANDRNSNNSTNNNSNNLSFHGAASAVNSSAVDSPVFSFVRPKGGVISFIKDSHPSGAVPPPPVPHAPVGYFTAGTAATDSQCILVSVPRELVLNSMNASLNLSAFVAPAMAAAPSMATSTPNAPQTTPVIYQRTETNANSSAVKSTQQPTINAQPTVRKEGSSSNSSIIGNNSNNINKSIKSNKGNKSNKGSHKVNTYDRDQLARSLKITASHRLAASRFNGEDDTDNGPTEYQAAVDTRRKVAVDPPLLESTSSNKRRRASPTTTDINSKSKKTNLPSPRSRSPVSQTQRLPDSQKGLGSTSLNDKGSRKDSSRCLSSSDRLSPKRPRHSSNDAFDEDKDEAPFFRLKGDYYRPNYNKRPLPPQFRKDKRRYVPVLKESRTDDRRCASATSAKSVTAASNTASESPKEPKALNDHPTLASPSVQRVAKRKKKQQQQQQQQPSQRTVSSSSSIDTATTSFRKVSTDTHEIITVPNTKVKPTTSITPLPLKVNASTRHNSMPLFTNSTDKNPQASGQEESGPIIKEEPMDTDSSAALTAPSETVLNQQVSATAVAMDTGIPIAVVKPEPADSYTSSLVHTDVIGHTASDSSFVGLKEGTSMDQKIITMQNEAEFDTSIRNTHAAAIAFLKETLSSAKTVSSTHVHSEVTASSTTCPTIHDDTERKSTLTAKSTTTTTTATATTDNAQKQIDVIERTEKEESKFHNKRRRFLANDDDVSTAGEQQKDGDTVVRTTTSTVSIPVPSNAINEEDVPSGEKLPYKAPFESTVDDDDDGFSSSDDTVMTALEEQETAEIEIAQQEASRDDEDSMSSEASNDSKYYDAETIERRRALYQQRIREMDIDERDDIVMDVNPATPLLLAHDGRDIQLEDSVESDSMLFTEEFSSVAEKEKARAAVLEVDLSAASASTCIAMQYGLFENEQQLKIEASNVATSIIDHLEESKEVNSNDEADSVRRSIPDLQPAENSANPRALLSVPPTPITPSIEKSVNEAFTKTDINSSTVAASATKNVTTSAETSSSSETNQQEPLFSPPTSVSEESTTVSENSTVACDNSTLALSALFGYNAANSDPTASSNSSSPEDKVVNPLMKLNLLNRPYKRVSLKWKVEMTETGDFIYIHKETGEVTHERPVDQ